ncbi:MAG: disulfide bond formation protein B [Planctomycetia bacterium]|nr:disulfide bond formation protein B [Planctomycetia bacterium]
MSQQPTPAHPECCSGLMLPAALFIAAAGTAGSLWLSLGMQLKPCPLCYYQRALVICVLAIYVVGVLARVKPQSVLHALALPAAGAGLGIAAWHVYLEAIGKLVCPRGIGGLGSAPQQSLAMYALLAIAVLCGALGGASRRVVPAAAGVLLAGLMAWGMIKAVPPPAPPQPYPGDRPPVCQPPLPSRAT